MRTPDEIKKALKLCYEDKCVPKDACPYASTCEECGDSDGFQRLKADALACIELLEEQVMLMKIQMHGDCGVCLHKAEAAACGECMEDDKRSLWEYEGLPEVQKNAQYS